VAGGALVAVLGPAPAFAVDAATFVVSALTLAGVRSAQHSTQHSMGITGARPTDAPVTATAAQEDQRQPAAAPGAGTPTVWKLLRSERILQICLLVTVAANLGLGGADEVALPSLVHGPLRGGAGSYGSLIAAFGAGALLGTLVAAQSRGARRPAVLGSLAFLGEALFLAVVPYLGGLIPAGAAMAVVGVCNGFGNVVMITLFQRWAPPSLLGRLSGLLMLASMGVFPISVALGALVVHNFGPALFFPLAAAVLAAAILAGLSQRTWRDFGVTAEATTAATPQRHRRDRRPGRTSTTTDTEYAS
jgi:hypothetical protein